MKRKICLVLLFVLAIAGSALAQKSGGPGIVGGIDFDRAMSCWDLNPVSTSRCYRGLADQVKRGAEKCESDQCREDSRKSFEALQCASTAVRKPGPSQQKESAQQKCLAPLK